MTCVVSGVVLVFSVVSGILETYHTPLLRGLNGHSVHSRSMSDLVDHPGCAHQVFQATHGRESEPTNICSCSAGLIHMHDCPVMNGMECRWFEASDTPEETLSYPDFVEVHGRLMDVFLSRIYQHRVRDLRPGTSEFARRREDLLERYAREVDSEPEPELTEEQVARYTEDKDRLIAQRKRREEQRAEQEAKSREERAQERAKMGIKTVVQKAQETVAARGGNVSESSVDEMPSTKPTKKKRRRRRKRSTGSDGAARPEGAGKADAGAKSAPTTGGPSSGQPAGDASKGAGEGGARKKRRRRRRRKPPSSSE